MTTDDIATVWDTHMQSEFVTKDIEAALDLMTDDAHVTHIPTMTGAHGRDELRRYYAETFLRDMPDDVTLDRVGRVVGSAGLADELIARFTHTRELPFILPGVEPTGRSVELPMVAVIGFRDGKIASEHLYWDQASVLCQIGLLGPGDLPIAGVEAARAFTSLIAGTR
ncbi:MAG: ester cyclase [Acidimicrobiales bacterium]